MKFKKAFLISILSFLFFVSMNYCASTAKYEPAPAPSSAGRSEWEEDRRSSKKKDAPAPASPTTSPKKGKSKASDGEALDLDEEERRPERPTTTASSESGLRAGFADDNKQFNLFINFLSKFKDSTANYPIDVSERIVIYVKDGSGLSVPGALVEVTAGKSSFGKKVVAKGTTYSDGSFYFYPSEHKEGNSFNVTITKNNAKAELKVDKQSQRTIPVLLENPNVSRENVNLDLLFIMDTTGSMGEEIERLKSTLEIINLNLSQAASGIRFGMVLYRDKRESYVTKVIPFTNDLNKFKKELNKVSAEGGGDYPEDLQAALQDAIQNVSWNTDSIKVAYVITDASPHLDYGQSYTYVNAVKDAREKGIKFYTIGTGGLDINGEYVLRQIAQYTAARYIFLTYGEKGESEGGAPGSVSHHTGANFATDKLESIVIRFTREELANAKGKPLEKGEEFFTAKSISGERSSDTLSKLFEKAVSQLVDYSAVLLKEKTTIAVIPFQFEAGSTKKDAEYFTEAGLLSFSRNKTFKVVERKDIQNILKEWKLNQTAIEEENAIKAGKLLGAQILATGKVYKKEKEFEIYLKLVSTETGEILCITKLLVDSKLGL